VQQSDPTSLVNAVLRGARCAGTDKAPTAPAMPAFSWVLGDNQIAAVLTYIRNTCTFAIPATIQRHR
jgi:mono/diheme cytochrome c family protein